MSRNLWSLLTILLALSLTACNGEEMLGTSERMWLWLVVPLCGFVLVGAALAVVRRRAQLDLWDPRRDQPEPAVRRILLAAIIVGLILAGAFTAYNFHLGIDPRQKLWNIGLWFLGTVLGTSVALTLGLRRAE